MPAGRRPRGARDAPPTRCASSANRLILLSDFSGEPYRIRTCDPLIKSQLLYQLS